MELETLKNENRNELSMVEVAFAILQESGNVYTYTEILELVQDYLGFSDEVLEDQMVNFYTQLNIDGRFISLGENRWGLRAWYPIDSIDEEIVSSIDDEDLPRRKRRKRALAFENDGEMIDYNADDPEDLDDYEDEDIDYDYDDDEDDDEDIALEEQLQLEDDPDDEASQELNEYARDLDDLGDDELDLDDDSLDFEDDDESAYEEEDEDEDDDEDLEEDE